MSLALRNRRLRSHSAAWHAAEVLEDRLLLTFGTNGIVVTDLAENGTIARLALQDDGKIVGAGNSGVIRYNTDGSLDISFNASGPRPGTIPASTGWLNDVVIRPDGRILTAGMIVTSNGRDFALRQYKADGTADGSFGANGIATTSFTKGKNDDIYGIALQPDGKVIAVGYANDSWGNAKTWAVVRYNANGSLDTTFNKTGKVLGFGKGSNSEEAYSVAVQADGKIVVAGRVADGDGGWDFALARYSTSGTLDATFGTGGKVQTDLGWVHEQRSSSDSVFDLLIQPDGKIVVAGGTSNGLPVVARYDAAGKLDLTFSGDGVAALDTLVGWGAVTEFRGVGLQSGPAGRLWIVAGGRPTMGVARLELDGTLDTDEFGLADTDPFAGWTVFSIAPFVVGEGYDLIVQPDGKILIGGGTGFGDSDYAVARLNPNGGLDADPPATSATTDPSQDTTRLLEGASDEDDLLVLLYVEEEDKMLFGSSV